MSQKIKETLENQFQKHGVIFWYDEQNEFFEDKIHIMKRYKLTDLIKEVAKDVLAEN